MREIKFRAWWGRGVVDFPSYINCETGETWSFIEGEGEKDNPQPILMQYTGLHDKNGKEIYEGDILRNPRVGDVGPVEWDDIEAGFHWVHSKMYNGTMDECEVIGNIYENPELVK